MKILDLDMDYFMYDVATFIPESSTSRLPEEFGCEVWPAERVRDFLENNLGLSKRKKINGRVVSGHNESILFWKELIESSDLITPFEVVHVDSHADLGLGYSSWKYILEELIQYPVKERPLNNIHTNCYGKSSEEGIGDYLLFAIAYRWISKLTYCANPNSDKNDYLVETLKDFHENCIWNSPVDNTIQLVHNPMMRFPLHDDIAERRRYLDTGTKEPEVPMLTIPSIEDVKFNGEFDFAVLAQSPNYTPASADFILNIFREYIDEL
jgi:hypothetical protein